MKKICYIATCLTAVLMSMISCTPETNHVFELSAQERLTEMANQCKSTLVSSEYGWKLTYDPQYNESAESALNYHFIMIFNEDGTVIQYSDFSDAYKTTPKVSTYTFAQPSQGATLTFDTPGIITELAMPDPKGGGSSLYNGDNEFAVYSVADDKVVLLGVKSHVKVILVKAESSDVAAYFSSVLNFRSFFVSNSGIRPFFPSLMFSDGSGICVKVGTNTRWFTFITPNADGTDTLMYKTSIEKNINGFSLNNPVTVGNRTMQNFVWDATAQNFHTDFDSQSHFEYSHTSPFAYGKTVEKYRNKKYRMIDYSSRMKDYCINNIMTGIPDFNYAGLEFSWNYVYQWVDDMGVSRKDSTFNFSLVHQPNNGELDYHEFGMKGYTQLRDDQAAFIDDPDVRTGSLKAKLKLNNDVKKLIAFFNDEQGFTIYEEGTYMYLISIADSRNWLKFSRN